MEDEDTTKATKFTRCEKTLVLRSSKVFKKKYLDRLEQYVTRSHDIFERASILLKFHILRIYEDLFKNEEVDTSRLEQFTENVQLKQLCDSAFVVVTTDFNKVKAGRPSRESSKSLLEALESSYQLLAQKQLFPNDKCDGKNLSHVIAFSKAQLRVAYLNNIKCHFTKYIKRTIRQRVRRDQQKADEEYLTSEERKAINRAVGSVLRTIFSDDPDFDTDNDDEDGNPYKHITSRFMADYPLPKEWFKLLHSDPVYLLPFMIKMNREFEREDIRQYSPLPFRSDFIPKSITICYSALCDMFITKDNIADLKLHVIGKGWKIPTSFTKSNFYQGRIVLDNWEYVGTDEYKQAVFRTHVWQFFTQKNIHYPYNDLIFSNLLSTNGYQVSVHYVDEESYKRKRYQQGVHVVQEEQNDEKSFPYVHKLTEGDRQSLLDSTLPKLFCDPGKTRILTIGYEGKDSQKIYYTKKQRVYETYEKRNNEERTYLLAKQHVSGETYGSIQGQITASSKSSFTSTFCTYLEQKTKVKGILQEFYSKNGHRRRRLRSHIGKQSTVDRLVHTIQKTFNPTKTTPPILFWGNWGRNPNLRNSAPSPGIGLKRLLARRLKIYTVDERGTSSRCPLCEHSLEYPLTRNVKRKNKKSGEVIQKIDHIHHVLRCKNETCGMWWDRDILALNNQYKQVMYNLTKGELHPIFTKTKRPTKVQSERCSRIGENIISPSSSATYTVPFSGN